MAFHASLKTQGFSQGIYEQSVIQKEELDTVRILKRGRMFAYARAGAVALGSGVLTQSPIPDSNAKNKAIVTASVDIGATSLNVTFGGAVTADFFKDGYLTVNDATGEGHFYMIKSHPAGTAAVTVDLYDPIRVALTVSVSEITLTANRQNLVLVNPTTLTATPAGVTPIPVDINYYFWNQVKGPAVVLTHGTIVIGNQVGPSSQSTPVAGAIEALASSDIIGSVGTCMQVNADTEYSLINLAIPGY
jgi:hypothetical protein